MSKVTANFLVVPYSPLSKIICLWLKNFKKTKFVFKHFKNKDFDYLFITSTI